ncbi:hypothetical protein EB74_28760 [Mycobacterium sp. SWH-M5]|nr:hypothetical protein EB74_28760 [Mycobacterium sp. SWH-M5]
MYARAHSAVLSTIAAAGIGAAAVAPVVVAPPPELDLPRIVHAPIELTASPALGALPLAFLRNQAQYCSVICPFIVQGLVTVPVGAALSPVAFLDSLGTTGSLTRAIGAAAASVTGPANAAAEGIILNDVDRVVPKAFNNLEIAVVQLLRVGAALADPATLPDAIDTARQTILDGLNQPLPGPGVPVPTETGARTLPEVVAVEAIKVAAAVAFQAGELVLLGVVQTADAAAQELARSGDPVRALSGAVEQAGDVLQTASKIVTDSVQTAATNIHNALGAPANPRTVTLDATPALTTKAATTQAGATPDSTTKTGAATTGATGTAEVKADSKSDATETDTKSGTAKSGTAQSDSTTSGSASKPVKASPTAKTGPVHKAVSDIGRALKSLTGSSTKAEKPQKSVSDKGTDDSGESGKTTQNKHTKSGKHAA